MLVFIPRIQAETSFLSYFPKTAAPRQATELVDRVFGGSDNVILIVDGDLKDPALLAAIHRFEQKVQAYPEVGSAASIADVIRELHKALTGAYGLPDSREGVAQEILLYQMSGDPEDLAQFMDEAATTAQVTVQVRSLPSGAMQDLVDRIQADAEAIIGPHASAVNTTGSTVLMLETMRLILHDQYVSLGLALVLVAFFNAWLLRSWVVGLVSIVPLVLTVSGQFGLMGLFGVPLDTATALIGAIAIGVGDYSVHIIVRYLEELRKGRSAAAAARESVYVSGRAVFFTALAIGGGFMALLFSGFAPIQTFAKLMGFTVSATALFALTALPAALLVFVRKDRKHEVVQDA
jgi:predicted RND superfamily exporter protein